MAWGIWNKIKKGFKKAGAFVKKAAGKVLGGIKKINDKVVKPLKPIIKTAANAIVPGSGAIIDRASNAVDGVVGWADKLGWN